MNLLNEAKTQKISNPEIEQIVREQMEFTILGTFLISKGFKLFAYSSVTNNVRLVKIKKGEFIQCELVKFPDGNPKGEWIWFDPENSNITIDSKEIYFEALNLRLANSRVDKFKQGKIKELMNLRKPNPNGINFFNEL